MSIEEQSAATVLMIRPARFEANRETQASNRFQSIEAPGSSLHAQASALDEFNRLEHALRAAGVAVHVFQDAPEPHTPDSIFPNNWVSFHGDGTVVLYPMLAPNRRVERRSDILEELSTRHGFFVSRVVDLTHYERSNKYLEGTGSLVLDRVNRVAYACLSPRTDLDVLGDFAQQLDYDIVAFEATDRNGWPIYHTNVLMCIGSRLAVVCSTCIRADEREGVLDALRSSSRNVLDLTVEQMQNFAGNMLELRTAQGDSIIAMSSRARACLTSTQRAAIEDHSGEIVAVPIPTIEILGGGSVRCMLAEIHLPRKQSLRFGAC